MRRLIWYAEHGGQIEYYEALSKAGEVTPIDKLEKLPRRLIPIWNAFHTLHVQRSVGLTANPLSVSDILGYLTLIGVTEHERRNEWFFILTTADQAWLSYQEEHSSGGGDKTTG